MHYPYVNLCGLTLLATGRRILFWIPAKRSTDYRNFRMVSTESTPYFMSDICSSAILYSLLFIVRT